MYLSKKVYVLLYYIKCLLLHNLEITNSYASNKRLHDPDCTIHPYSLNSRKLQFNNCSFLYSVTSRTRNYRELTYPESKIKKILDKQQLVLNSKWK